MDNQQKENKGTSWGVLPKLDQADPESLKDSIQGWEEVVRDMKEALYLIPDAADTVLILLSSPGNASRKPDDPVTIPGMSYSAIVMYAGLGLAVMSLESRMREKEGN